jgi:precorrin-8X/cobalt-precorrin-8 methylmutase
MSNLSDKTNSIRIIEPAAIEHESFTIIESELRSRVSLDHQYHPDRINQFERAILYRMIHTSADFDYADNLIMSSGLAESYHDIISTEPVIITDTNMAAAGINKTQLGRVGGEVHCYIADEDVAKSAVRNGSTRAAASIDKSLIWQETRRPVIYAIGNAPTALIRLHQLIKIDKLRPALIIAAPVGFVNVIESKNLIKELDLPSIIADGRKGGSNIAAAVCNALIYQTNGRLT